MKRKSPRRFQAGNPREPNEPPATSQQIAGWHEALQRQAGATPELTVSAAIYVTGQSNVDLPALQSAFERADKAALSRFPPAPVLGAILPRLPWPEAGR